MTCIVFDGATLAADTLITEHEGSVIWAEKFSTHKDGVLAYAGEAHSGSANLRLFKRLGRQALHSEDWVTERDVEYLYIQYGRNRCEVFVYLVDNLGHAVRLKHNFGAIGSGRPYALLAMMLGLSADEAVRATAKINSSVGGEVSTLAVRDKSYRVDVAKVYDYKSNL